MELRNEFTLPARADEAYRFLLDLERVAPCIPGGDIGARGPDGSYPATVTVKLGPMRLRYQGTVRIAEREDGARRAVLAAEAREARGHGSAKARMTMSVSGDDKASHVDVVTEMELSGRAAQMGRGVVDDVARRLVADMATCLESTFTAGAPEFGEAAVPAAEPLAAGALFFSALWSRLKRLLGADLGKER
jgi:carbon monoxide dehydrogenase subunit G